MAKTKRVIWIAMYSILIFLISGMGVFAFSSGEIRNYTEIYYTAKNISINMDSFKAYCDSNTDITEIYFGYYDEGTTTQYTPQSGTTVDLTTIDAAAIVDVSESNDGKITAYKNGAQLYVLSNRLIGLPADVSGMFQDKTALTKIKFHNIDTSQTTNFNSMFSGCSALQEVDVTRFNTSKAEHMSNMFIKQLLNLR